MRIIVASLLLTLLWACDAPVNYTKIAGETMGTTYHITYKGSFNHQQGIDSLLVEVNQSMSTYIPTSTISRINSFEDTVISIGFDEHFWKVYQNAMLVAEQSKGAFDFTVMPIVNHYGFGYKNQGVEDLEQWQKFIGYDKVNISVQGEDLIVHRKDPRVLIDFSAIAKGYGVDVVAELLEGKGISDYMVEIGGEVRCSGINNRNKVWSIGIDQPVEGGNGKLQEVVQLNDKAMATSGNYRNFKVINGNKVAHTIDPRMGKPSITNVLSASVFHENCMLADAYATTLMVLGYPDALEFIKDVELDAYLVYTQGDSILIESNYQ